MAAAAVAEASAAVPVRAAMLSRVPKEELLARSAVRGAVAAQGVSAAVVAASAVRPAPWSS